MTQWAGSGSLTLERNKQQQRQGEEHIKLVRIARNPWSHSLTRTGKALPMSEY